METQLFHVSYGWEHRYFMFRMDGNTVISCFVWMGTPLFHVSYEGKQLFNVSCEWENSYLMLRMDGNIVISSSVWMRTLLLHVFEKITLHR